MTPNQVIPYYPTYADLDSVVSSSNFKEIRLFVDVKNISTGMYSGHVVEDIVEMSSGRFVCSVIFSALLSFVAFHRVYAMKRSLNIKMYFFMESGQSFFHTNILPSYKAERKLSPLGNLTTEGMLDYFRIVRKNLELSEFVLSKIKGISFIRLVNLEADFVPYYTIRYLSEPSKDVLNIIYSTDKDLLQTLTIPDHNVVQFFRTLKKKMFITKDQVMPLVMNIKSSAVDPQFAPLAQAIMGDPSDGVPGFYGIGGSRCNKILEILVPKLNCSMDDLSFRASTGEDLFKGVEFKEKDEELPDGILRTVNRVLREEKYTKIVSKNLKLVSFDTLIKSLQNDVNGIPKLDFVRVQVENLDTDLVTKEQLSKAIVDLGIIVEDYVLDQIFLGDSFAL